MLPITDAWSLDAAVRKAVAETTVTDIHTHLFPPSHGKLLLWGVDELLTYHYLVAELFTVAPRSLTPADFWKMSKSQQADLIWKSLFIERGPVSEACRGVLTTLSKLGLDVASRNLGEFRKFFAGWKAEDYVAKVFQIAGLDYAVMTNDPFKSEAVEHWQASRPGMDCLKTALRIDTLILDWPAAAKTMAAAGYATEAALSEKGYAEARRFLIDWAKRIKPVYMAASMPPSFAYPSETMPEKVIDHVVMPVAQELGLPVAMMIGVRKRVNPSLGDGGDAVGVADVTAVQNLCTKYPAAKFLITMLSRDNQHELHVLARKFGNLHMFGCWWFCNNPSIIRELAMLRLELLGTAVTAQHSDARILDQLIYKWSHSRAIIADVLAEKYRLAFESGWRPTDAEVRRDARALLGGSFEAFLRK
jgi:hypothetical protein